MVNAYFECRYISQFKGLIDVINYWKWRDKKKTRLREEMLVQFKPGYWVITGVVDLGLRSGLYVWKAYIGLKLSCGVQDLKVPFSSSNGSNNSEVRICPAHTLFGFQLISWVLEVQMSSGFFCWKAEIIAHNFHKTRCPNDVLARQQYQ